MAMIDMSSICLIAELDIKSSTTDPITTAYIRKNGACPHSIRDLFVPQEMLFNQNSLRSSSRLDVGPMKFMSFFLDYMSTTKFQGF